MCNKKCFETEEDAIEHNYQQRAYFCDRCYAWHLTSGLAGRIHRVRRSCGMSEAQRWFRRHSRSRKKQDTKSHNDRRYRKDRHGCD